MEDVERIIQNVHSRLEPTYRDIYSSIKPNYPSYLIPCGVTLGYLAFVASRPLFKKYIDSPLLKTVQKLLAVIGPLWNISLCLFSLVCVLMVIPEYLNIYKKAGVFGLMCDKERLVEKSLVLNCWGFAFVLSKFAELFDTVFLVMKNPTRRINFLHWYHHATVLLFCWFALGKNYSPGYLFLIVNGAVHTIMYAYYALKEMGINPPFPIFITFIQIIQMIIGLVVNGYFAHLHLVQDRKCNCNNSDVMILSCAIMYGSYLLLFINFFISRYLTKKPKKQ